MLAVRPNLKEFHLFFDITLDLVCIANKQGYFKEINHSVSEKLGYTQDELLSRPIASFIHPEDRDRTAAFRNRLLEGTPLLNFQNRYLTKTGSTIWLEWTSVYIPEQEVVFAIAKDITIRKLVELEITGQYEQYKSLAHHFKNKAERDRKYIAVELHEELAQLASVVKMNLECLQKNEQQLSAEGVEKLKEAVTVSHLLMNSIRRISFSISPAMLNDLGLQETLQWLCKEFSVLSGIPCTVTGSCNVALLSMEVQLDIFRICQEALQNILYHAGASAAALRITETENIISFIIEDNGRGFDSSAAISGQGLQHIQNRAASVNSQLVINSLPGKGTSIEFLFKK